ncbi:type II toxin-antitoxin system antitoxin SocA domain-containing protein [Tabrizicola sp.]|uniref:Panacea domain-containing protein n=1 Tax=Tabrizicola sp. TaxID=2005166 RepID=UPI00286B5817|nr:type II toxin-antitoxin system antitoxin SocA domain-containing protein [Tabrizicola sp.]
MTYDARQVANWFVTRAQRDGRVLSIMSLLKLTYISHGWHLEMRDTPLFPNRIEAWQHGPVIPDVYHDFRRQGIDVTSVSSAVPTPELDQWTAGLLEQIYANYGNLTPFRLSDLTHVHGGPWDLARQTGGWYAPIPDDMIRQHYKLKRLEASQPADA